MSSTASSQLDAIHAMLATGHRSIRMERHSLMIWGWAGAFLCIVADLVITPERFPDILQAIVALIALISVVLLAAGVLDFRLTRRLRHQRGESLSFVHRQVYKVWWLLLTLGVLLTFGMELFGGGYMVYGVWLVLIGLGLYVHGLFSEQALEWGGVLIIVIGVGALALNLPYEAMRWLAASVLGVGVPLLALAVDRDRPGDWSRRLLQSSVWLVAVLLPAALIYQAVSVSRAPGTSALSLDVFHQQAQLTGTRVVALPAGTRIPLVISMQSNVLEDMTDATVPLILSRPLEVALVEGKPDGRFRVADGAWQMHPTGLRLRVDKLTGSLTAEGGPMAGISIRMSVADR